MLLQTGTGFTSFFSSQQAHDLLGPCFRLIGPRRFDTLLRKSHVQYQLNSVCRIQFETFCLLLVRKNGVGNEAEKATDYDFIDDSTMVVRDV